MGLLNTPDSDSVSITTAYGDRMIAIFQQGQAQPKRSAFPNHTRTRPIEERYRGEARVAKLKELKKHWDPQGVFTTEFLEVNT